jgi:site-specific recombinase XerD
MAVKRNDSNDSLRMPQEQLGYASISTTMKYRKMAGSELRSWYDNLWQDEGHVEQPAP